jgi:hypothetical protein
MRIEPGTIIEVQKMGVVKHPMTFVGPIGPRGEDVVNNTPERGVHLDHHENAIAGRPCRVSTPAPATLQEKNTVVRRALSQLGRQWRLFTNNCESTANYARTGIARSPQVGLFLVVGLVVCIAGVVMLSSRRP